MPPRLRSTPPPAESAGTDNPAGNGNPGGNSFYYIWLVRLPAVCAGLGLRLFPGGGCGDAGFDDSAPHHQDEPGGIGVGAGHPP